MRHISTAAAAQVAKQMGQEPINVIGVTWVPGSHELYYADSDIGTSIKGLLLEIGPLDDVMNVSENSDSASFALKLDDTSGDLKTLINQHDIHKMPVTLYQWYPGLNLTTDLIPIFQGEISSPIIWGERDRTLAFTVISRIETRLVGFSPEEGQIPWVNYDLLGKPWPLAFGQVVNSPCTLVRESVVGQLKQVIGIVDTTFQPKLLAIATRMEQLQGLQAYINEEVQLVQSSAPDPQTVLDKYLEHIVREDKKRKAIQAIKRQIQDKQDDADKAGDPVAKQAIEVLIQNLEKNIVAPMNDLETIVKEKQQLEQGIQLCQFFFNLLTELQQKYNQCQLQIVKLEQMQLRIAYLTLQQEKYELSSFNVAYGFRFPQGTPIDILVNNMRYNGVFSGDLFTVTAGPLPAYTDLAVTNAPDGFVQRYDAFYLADDSTPINGCYCLTTTGDIVHVIEQRGPECVIELIEVPPPQNDSSQNNNNNNAPTPISGYSQSGLDGADPIDNQEYVNIKTLENIIAALNNNGNFSTPAPAEFDNFFAVLGNNVLGIREVAAVPLPWWYIYGEFDPIKFLELPTSATWKAETGTTVYPAGDQSLLYCANMVPSTVWSVSAWRTWQGVRTLTLLPPDYYTIEGVTTGAIAPYGIIHATMVRLKQPLSYYQGEGWEEDLFVNQTSSIGSNTADQIKWLIEHYTVFTADSTTFNLVHNQIDNYPSNFVMLDRKNVTQVLQEMAWQARCAVWEVNGVFKIRYLSTEPASDVTLHLSDCLDIALSFTATEDIITRLIGNWTSNYAYPQDQVIVGYNVLKYGTLEQSFDFYIYSGPTSYNLVNKSAAYWTIQYANTWKLANIKVPATKIAIETFDVVTLDLGNTYFANGPVKGIVKSATFDSQNQTMDLQIKLPIRSGEMKPYYAYWPSDLTLNDFWPPIDDQTGGYAGDDPPLPGVGEVPPIQGLDGGGASGGPPGFGNFVGDPFDGNTNPNVAEQIQAQGAGDREKFIDFVGFPKMDEIDPNNKTVWQPGTRPVKRTLHGYVVAKIGRHQYTVTLSSGNQITAIQTNLRLNQVINQGDEVAVTEGHQPGEWLMQVPVPPSRICEVLIQTVKSDYIICTSPDDPTKTINVAKPVWLQKFNWFQKTINGIYYDVVNAAGATVPDSNGQVRVASGNFNGPNPNHKRVLEVLYPFYNSTTPAGQPETLIVADIVGASRMGDPAIDPKTTNWVDLNTTGRHFRPLQTNLQIAKLTAQLNKDSQATAQLFSGPSSFTLFTQANISFAGEANWQWCAPGEQPFMLNICDNATGIVKVTDLFLKTGQHLSSGTIIFCAVMPDGRVYVLGAAC